MSRRISPLLFCLASAVACGRVDRPVGSYVPELAQAGQGQSGDTAEPDPSHAPHLDEPWLSLGCGHQLPTEQVPTVPGNRTGYTEWQVNQTGATLSGTNPALAGSRHFSVRVPADYDPNRPYRVVYLARGGCDAQSTFSQVTYDLYDETRGGSEQAVYVDIALPSYGANPDCYDTTTGLDSIEYEVFELIHAFVESRYCVDNNRIFTVGYSQGGGLSNMWGCYFGGTPTPARRFSPKWAIRGHAVAAGWREANQPVPCNGPGAGIWIHDVDDLSQGMYDSNTSALMLALQSNACSGNYDDGPKQAWTPTENVAGLEGGACQLYTGCSPQSRADYPLVFCNAPGVRALGGSDRPDIAIPAFTAFFASMDAKP